MGFFCKPIGKEFLEKAKFSWKWCQPLEEHYFLAFSCFKAMVDKGAPGVPPSPNLEGLSDVNLNRVNTVDSHNSVSHDSWFFLSELRDSVDQFWVLASSHIIVGFIVIVEILPLTKKCTITRVHCIFMNLKYITGDCLCIIYRIKYFNKSKGFIFKISKLWKLFDIGILWH